MSSESIRRNYKMENSKKIIIGIIALALIIVLAVIFSYSKTKPTQPQNTLETASSNQATSTVDVTQDNQASTTTSVAPILDFSDSKMLTIARSIPKDISVIHIRKVFNEYVSGAKGNLDYDDVLNTTEVYKEDSLSQFDKSLYRSRFIVNAVNSNAMGGELYDVIFLDYPQKVYSAWIYMQGEGTGTPSFRTFQINDAYPVNYGEEFLRLNPRLKTDTSLSI